MDASQSRIAARSRRQAMDWSLVLISQGIECTIDFSDPEPGWGLLVDAAAHERALGIIRQYRLENRRWPWRMEVPSAGIVFDTGSFAWVCLLFLFAWANARYGLREDGMMDAREVGQGAWWRLFTAIWLHADMAHLLSNAALGLVLVGLAMGRYGTGLGLVGAYLAGAGGNLLVLVTSQDSHRSLGASGMVMGALGLLAVRAASDLRSGISTGKGFMAGILGGTMLFILFGLAPGTDVVAHLGGFLSGITLGFVAGPLLRMRERAWLSSLAGAAFVLLTSLPWWLALRGR